MDKKKYTVNVDGVDVVLEFVDNYTSSHPPFVIRVNDIIVSSSNVDEYYGVEVLGETIKKMVKSKLWYLIGKELKNDGR